MTWWTEDGHVTMPKPVIELMAEAAMALRDEIVEEIALDDPDLHPHVGVPAFDSLEPRTQIFALAHVLRHLSEPDLPSPDLYAWNEGTAWAIIVEAEHELGMELDMEEGAEPDLKYGFRRLIQAALKTVDPSARCPSVRSRNLDAWKGCLETIAERLFWDLDFLEEAAFADLGPTTSRLTKILAGISEDYFSSPPPLVREEDYREADRYLRQVAGCPQLLDPWDQGGR